MGMERRSGSACAIVLLAALCAAAAAQGQETVALYATHWNVNEALRWYDIPNNPYATAKRPGGVYAYDYLQASVTLTYNATDTTFVGTLVATGLKPNFAYQVKLNGKPTSSGWSDPDDLANQVLLDLGRSWGDEGYIIFDYFVTDDQGNAIVDLRLDSSYHVLWRTPGSDYPINPQNSPDWYDQPYPPAVEVGIDPEPEPGKPTPGNVVLPEGSYNVRFFLTEETFHESFDDYYPVLDADWPTVMAWDYVQFTVQRTTPPPPNVEYWAVICGISNYKKINDLNYCDDDARDIAAALRQFAEWQQAENQIEVLIDSAASKAGVQAAIARMGQKANADTSDHDVCLFFFSGHGTQVSDSSGDETTDGIDEAICAWDTQVKGIYIANVITDDELGAWLPSSLPADATVVTILDTCFSGGMAKGVSGAQVKSIRNPALPPKAKAKVGFGKGLAQRLTKGKGTTTPKGATDIGGTNAVVLMACQEGALSYETSELQNGVFSYFIIDGIGTPASVPADDDDDGLLAAEEVFDYAAMLTTVYEPDQVPRLYDGNPDAEAVILTTTPPEPVHDVAVTSVAAPSPVVQGTPVDVDVTVANQGNQSETLDVTLTDGDNGPTIGTESVSLAAGESTHVIFPWDTTDLAGDHILTATAGPVTGETDTVDNTGSTTVTVNPQGSAVVRVASIAMGIESAGKNWKATALVTVVDQSGGPAGGATVAADWSLNGSYIGSSTGVTDGLGQVTLTSPPKKAKSGQIFRIDITAVTKAGYDYDAAGSETTDQIAVPN